MGEKELADNILEQGSDEDEVQCFSSNDDEEQGLGDEAATTKGNEQHAEQSCHPDDGLAKAHQYDTEEEEICFKDEALELS